MRHGMNWKPGLWSLGVLLIQAHWLFANPAPPTDLRVTDANWDGGQALEVSFTAPSSTAVSATGEGDPTPVAEFSIRVSSEPDGLYEEVESISVGSGPLQTEYTATVGDLVRGQRYYVSVVAVDAAGGESPRLGLPADGGVVPTRQLFDGTRFWLLVIGGIICGSVIVFIAIARSGRTLYIRKIAGLEAVEEAVGRATEMGRACLFVPGIQDINDIQTIAGLAILDRVAHRAAEYDAELEVPTSKSLVMTAARETVQAAFLAAGRPDAYREDAINYVTDEQFGYVAYLTGQMVREKPAACFYMGAFFAESLILAETGNSIGAIQVAGTAQPAQLPFFVAACDYTLIGEEFFAASAYLSHDPDQLGSLKGQDVGKLIVAGLMVVGVGLLMAAAVFDKAGMSAVAALASDTANYLRNVILASG
ncbi:MAG: fibronectin type III domain-containing protein [Planctomycetaceae bacterium]